MGQGLHIPETVNAGQGVVGAVDGGQCAAIGPVRQLRHLIAGEIKALQLGKILQHGNVRNGVAGNAQILKFRQASQLGHIGKLVVVHRKVRQQHQLLHAFQHGNLVVVGIQPGEPGTTLQRS